MTLGDTGPLIALIDSDDVHHERCKTALASLSGLLITTLQCFTEAMHFLGKAGGWRFQETLWNMALHGGIQLHVTRSEELRRMREFMHQYRDSPMDIADASLVAAAETLNLLRIFTLDSHFRAYRVFGTQAMIVLP